MILVNVPSIYDGREVTPGDFEKFQVRSAIFRKVAMDGDRKKLLVPKPYANLIKKHLKLHLLKPTGI